MKKTNSAKPRLLFFQYKYDNNLPAFLLVHKQEHVDCLSHFFEVTVVREDCDYGEVCDTYEPDLALFESGVPFETCRRPVIKNVRANARVPKLGFLHSDGFCEARAGFLSDMDHWGIDTFFAIAVTAAEYTPAIAENLFVWPNFVDTLTYRDYRQWKNIPVLFTGNTNALYPWRKKILKLVSSQYPSLISPHPGYSPSKVRRQVTIGEPYARMLNASCFVPACGTIAKEVVRKHFEVPACRACLVTEKSPGLQAAGFVDMVNCVFADEHDVLDKLAYLFERPEQLQAVTDAGHELVHSRHTLRHRDQVRQWFDLYRSLGASEKIIQENPFEPLRAVPRSRPSAGYFRSSGSHLTLLAEGDRELSKCSYAEAERSYIRCLQHYRFMPEPQLRLAICSLYTGDAAAALSWIRKPIQFTLAEYRSLDPDPVEWAYFIIALLCAGKSKEAVTRAGQFNWLRHPELDRARIIASVIQSSPIINPPLDENAPIRRSMHQLPSRNLETWTREVCMMLKACRQMQFAAKLETCPSQELTLSQETRHLGATTLEANPLASKAAVRGFERRESAAKFKDSARRASARFLHALEGKLGHFLPYRLSAIKNDHFLSAIHSLSKDDDVKTVLAIGLHPNESTTQALFAGLRENSAQPLLYCISASKQAASRSTTGNVNVRWRRVHSASPEEFSTEIETIVSEVHSPNGSLRFDMLLADLSAWKTEAAFTGMLRTVVPQSRRILLKGINGTYNQLTYFDLLEDARYKLVEQDSELRDGYAIFEREPGGESAIACSRAAFTSLEECACRE